MDEKMRGLNCKNIEIDEIWGFVGAKQKNAARAGAYGDVWTFIALDSDSKLIPSHLVEARFLPRQSVHGRFGFPPSNARPDFI